MTTSTAAPNQDILTLINSLSIPSKIGSISLKVIPQGEINGLIVHLQDLHANYGVQLNQAKIIEILVRKYDFELILVEGATGPADFQLLDIMSPVLRRWYFRSLMKKGYVTGPEYSVVATPNLAFELWGIDSRKWYNLQHEAAAHLLNDQKKALADIEKIYAKLINAPLPISADLKQFLDARQQYISYRDKFTDLLASFDFKKEEELRLLFLRKFLLYGNVTGCLEECPQNLRQAIERDVFAASTTSSKGSANKDIDYHVVDDISEVIQKELIYTAIDECLVDFIKFIELGKIALHLRLLPEKAQEYIQIMADEPIQKTKHNLNTINDHLPTQHQLEFPSYLFPLLKEANQYYGSAANRSSIFVDNAVTEMKRRNLNRAILFTGGFHTGNCAEKLKEKYGIASLAITPDVKKLDDTAYIKRILEDSKDKTIQQDESPMQPPMPWWLRWSHGAYNIIGEFHRQTRQKNLRKWLPQIVESLYLQGGETVLDVGCGQGLLLAAIASRLRTGKVIGLENFEIDLLPGENPNLTWQTIVAEGVTDRVSLVNHITRFSPFESGSFDIVTNVSLDNIFNAGECKTTLREMMRVLKSGGRLVIFVSKYTSLCQKVLEHSGMRDIETQYLSRLSSYRLITACKPD